MKIVLISCLFILIICLAACSPTPTPAASPTSDPYIAYYKSCVAGNVEITSGDKKITPFHNYVWSCEWVENGWINGDGVRFEYQSATQHESAEKQFQTLDYADGLDASIAGNAWFSAHYVFYRDGLVRSEDHHLQNGEMKLDLPKDAGTYIVDLEITWLGQPLPNGKQNPAYITMEYLFKARYAPAAEN